MKNAPLSTVYLGPQYVNQGMRMLVASSLLLIMGSWSVGQRTLWWHGSPVDGMAQAWLTVIQEQMTLGSTRLDLPLLSHQG